MIDQQLSKYISSCLTEYYHNEIKLSSAHSVSGGDINAAWCLETSAGKFMMKLNSRSAYPGMFACEAEGLAAIRNTQTIAVPEVILYSDHDDQSFLIMQWVDSRRATPDASEQLGLQLAAMHRNTADQFGFEHDNYMGSLPQSNREHNSWAEFFVNERLQPMIKIGLDKGLLNSSDITNFEQLCSRISGSFDEEPPALLHGDLWGGNYLIGLDGTPYLIDPAICYGHREFDIAMTTLFGGFSKEFYIAYHEAFPLAKGWQQRIDLWNLYPLLLHLNLFGTGYLGQVRGCLKGYL